MTNSQIPPENVVTFHPLHMHEEDGEWIVGPENAPGRFLAVPEVGARAIRLLLEGHSIEEVERSLSEAEGEHVEVREFVETLQAYGLVARIGEAQERIMASTGDTGSGIGVLTRFPRAWFSWLYARPVRAAVALTTLAVVATFVLNPAYLPHPGDLLWHPSLFVSLITSFAVTWTLVLLHELGHLAAAKAVGVEGRVNISHRLQYVIAETDVTGLWRLGRRERVFVFLAGPAVDIGVLVAALGARLLSDLGALVLPPLAITFVKMIAFVKVVSLVWQLAVYMRTDGYYVLSALLRTKNLYANAWSYIGANLRGNGAGAPLDVPARELRAVRAYLFVLVLGTAATVGLFVFLLLPLTVLVITRAAASLALGPAAGAPFLDGLAVVLVNVAYLGLLGFALVREKRLRSQASPRTPKESTT